MPRAKRGNKRLQKRKDLEKLSKGYRGTKSKLYRSMRESVQRALKFAYVGRKLKKREYRSLWIVRISAATRLNGMSYSQFMHGLKVADINLDRKLLADIAVTDAKAFADLVGQAKKALGANDAASTAPAPVATAPAKPVKAAAEPEVVKAPAVEAAVAAPAVLPEAAVETPIAAPAVVPEAVVETPVTAEPEAAPAVEVPVATEPEAVAEATNSDLINVEGIGPAYLKKLNDAGIFNRAGFLAKGATAEGLTSLAESSSIGEAMLSKWVSQIDLERIPGLTDQDAEILVAAGVNSAQSLGQINPDELNGKMIAINVDKNLVQEVPSVAKINEWIEQAKQLPAIAAA